MTTIIEKIGEVITSVIRVVFSPVTNALDALWNRIEEVFTGLVIGEPFLQCISACIENFIPVNAFYTALTISLPLMAINFTVAQMKSIQSLININKFKKKWFT